MKNMRNEQRGMVLLVSLLILLLMAIIAAAVTQTNTLQLQMAGNDESKTDAIQRALAVVDAVIDNPKNTPVRGDIGYTWCKPGSTKSCDEYNLSVEDEVVDVDGDGNATAAEKSQYEYIVTRVGPEYISLGALGRRDDSRGDSGLDYQGAVIEVSGSFDGTDKGLGSSSVVQGVMIKIPVMSQ
jgi:archaellum component FlaG (FlaF/FlaG flagellin family)